MDCWTFLGQTRPISQVGGGSVVFLPFQDPMEGGWVLTAGSLGLPLP